MAITNASKEALIPLIIGTPENIWRNRTGKELVSLFQNFGFREDVYENGLPKLDGSNLNTSKKQYTQNRLLQLSEGQLINLITRLIKESIDTTRALGEINNILRQDNIELTFDHSSEEIKWEGVVIDRHIQNLASFQENERQVIDAIKKAKVSILIAMAWFTNDTIREVLEQKHLEGLRIEIVIFKDGVNFTHGVDLSNFDYKEVRGTRGGIMHNKFCIIDNLIVITGSYNWSANAEYRNDENVLITSDHETATKYSVGFRNLKPLL